MSQQRFNTIALAVAAMVCQHAMAARPVDKGTPGYAKRVYVDHTAASCTAVATCGTQAKPFSDLASAIQVVTPGTELITAGDSPYYGTPTGALPTNITRGVINFEQLKSSETQASTLVRKWTGTTNPVIRGSLKVTGWKRVGSIWNGLPSYTYSHRWTLTNQQAFATNPTKVVEPQQVFNGTTSLLQVGGTPSTTSTLHRLAPNTRSKRLLWADHSGRVTSRLTASTHSTNSNPTSFTSTLATRPWMYA